MIDGKWWLYFGEERRDDPDLRYCVFAAGEVTDWTGAVGRYSISDAVLRLDLPSFQPALTFRATDEAGNELPIDGTTTSLTAWDEDGELVILEKTAG